MATIAVNSKLHTHQVEQYYALILQMLNAAWEETGSIKNIWNYYEFGNPTPINETKATVKEDKSYHYPGDETIHPIVVFSIPEQPEIEFAMYRSAICALFENNVCLSVGRMD